MVLHRVWKCYLLTDVEPQYTGARIEGEVVTLDFVKKMMEDFKNQKCLHKRFLLIVIVLMYWAINFFSLFSFDS